MHLTTLTLLLPLLLPSTHSFTVVIPPCTKPPATVKCGGRFTFDSCITLPTLGSYTTVQGNTLGAAHKYYSQNCQHESAAFARTPSFVYYLKSDMSLNRTLTFDLGPTEFNYDTTISVLDCTDGHEVACNDDCTPVSTCSNSPLFGRKDVLSRVTAQLLPNKVYAVIVAGVDSITHNFAYSLKVSDANLIQIARVSDPKPVAPEIYDTLWQCSRPFCDSLQCNATNNALQGMCCGANQPTCSGIGLGGPVPGGCDCNNPPTPSPTGTRRPTNLPIRVPTIQPTNRPTRNPTPKPVTRRPTKRPTGPTTPIPTLHPVPAPTFAGPQFECHIDVSSAIISNMTSPWCQPLNCSIWTGRALLAIHEVSIRVRYAVRNVVFFSLQLASLPNSQYIFFQTYGTWPSDGSATIQIFSQDVISLPPPLLSDSEFSGPLICPAGAFCSQYEAQPTGMADLVAFQPSQVQDLQFCYQTLLVGPDAEGDVLYVSIVGQAGP